MAPYYDDPGLGQEEGPSELELQALILHGSTALQIFASHHQVPGLSLQWLCSQQTNDNIYIPS